MNSLKYYPIPRYLCAKQVAAANNPLVWLSRLAAARLGSAGSVASGGLWGTGGLGQWTAQAILFVI